MAERVVVVVAAAYPGAGCRAGEGSGSCIIRASVGDGNVLRTRAAPVPTIVAQDVHSTLHQLVWNRVVANWPDPDANKPQPPLDPLFIWLAFIIDSARIVDARCYCNAPRYIELTSCLTILYQTNSLFP